jgi:hypothetical protein
MRTPTQLCIVLLALCGGARAGFPQSSGPQKDRLVLPAERNEIIAGTLDSLQRFYFSRDAARRVAEIIRARHESGAYGHLDSANALARALSEDLQSAAKDLHLRVIYSDQPIPPKPASSQRTPEQLARMQAFHARRNYGLVQLSRLPGNIGYMDMRVFADTAVASEALATAMRFLSGTDALIIDLRNNRGGEPEMLALLASYFFEARTLLTTLTSDDTSRMRENWTVPVRGPKYLGRQVYVVTSSRVTFSAAEGFSYVMQALGKARVVGEKTGGGSNPSDGYILNRNFAILIPYATPVVSATGSNWAGGVVPDLPATADAAVRTAHVAALETLLQGKPDDLTGERRNALADLKRQTEAPPAP